jgi:undecaprenyl pyrophosphate phosphatase UppP
VQKLIFVAISHGWEVFYHEGQIRAVIFIFSKDLGKFRKKLKNAFKEKKSTRKKAKSENGFFFFFLDTLSIFWVERQSFVW